MANVADQPESFEHNDQVTPDAEVETPHYRELQPAPAQLPVRMKFDPPIEFDGKKYGQIVCDFDSLTAADFQRAEREFQTLYKASKNEGIPFPDMKPLYP
jgi:hypothetical protein